MQEVYTVMTATLGVPIRPDQTFNWEYYEDGPGGNGKAKSWQGTPREFYTTIAQGKYKVCRVQFRKKDAHVCVLSADRVVFAYQRSKKRLWQTLHRRQTRQCLGRPPGAMWVVLLYPNLLILACRCRCQHGH